jgi:hypothetical protein
MIQYVRKVGARDYGYKVSYFIQVRRGTILASLHRLPLPYESTFHSFKFMHNPKDHFEVVEKRPFPSTHKRVYKKMPAVFIYSRAPWVTCLQCTVHIPSTEFKMICFSSCLHSSKCARALITCKCVNRSKPYTIDVMISGVPKLRGIFQPGLVFRPGNRSSLWQ